LSKAAGFARLTRPVNSAMMGFATIIGEAIAARGVPGARPMALGFATAFLLSAASMAVNDYYDRKVDAINAPERPLPSGLISPREALVFTAFLTAGGLASAALTSLKCLLTALASFGVSFAYNTKGKKTGLPGNMMVSACVSIPFIYGGLAVADKGGIGVLTIIFAAMAFLSNTGREITKGIADVKGDRLRNMKTIAVRFGPKTAAVVSALFYASAVSLSAVPCLLSSVSWLYLPLVLISDVGFVASSLSLLRNPSRKNAMKVKRRMLLWMMMGLAAFVVGGVRVG